MTCKQLSQPHDLELYLRSTESNSASCKAEMFPAKPISGLKIVFAKQRIAFVSC